MKTAARLAIQPLRFVVLPLSVENRRKSGMAIYMVAPKCALADLDRIGSE